MPEDDRRGRDDRGREFGRRGGGYDEDDDPPRRRERRDEFERHY